MHLKRNPSPFFKPDFPLVHALPTFLINSVLVLLCLFCATGFSTSTHADRYRPCTWVKQRTVYEKRLRPELKSLANILQTFCLSLNICCLKSHWFLEFSKSWINTVILECVRGVFYLWGSMSREPCNIDLNKPTFLFFLFYHIGKSILMLIHYFLTVFFTDIFVLTCIFSTTSVHSACTQLHFTLASVQCETGDLLHALMAVLIYEINLYRDAVLQPFPLLCFLGRKCSQGLLKKTWLFLWTHRGNAFQFLCWYLMSLP